MLVSAMVTSIRGSCILITFAAALAIAPTAAAEFHINLDPPGPREFILDKAHKLDPATQDKLREACDKLLTDKATPIVIVTINSIGDINGDGHVAMADFDGLSIASGRRLAFVLALDG
jgi:uncharacterized protein